MIKQKQRLFCEYLIGESQGNATDAALKAGYSERSARQTAHKILQNKEVQAYLRELNAKIITENIATIQEIQEFWSKIMRDEEEPTKNRVRASELLAKTKGMFNIDW